MPVEQLQYELQKADHEFRNKGAATGQSITNAPVQARAAKADGSGTGRVQQAQASFVSRPVSKWKVVTESSGFREVEEPGDVAVKTEPIKEECFEPEPEIPLPQEPETKWETAQVEVKKEHVEEKVVTLNSSGKSKNKVISFKKRKNDSANFKARTNDD